MRKVVLVTGTSSGIGREAVHHLVRRGCHVVATARDPGDIDDLRADHVETRRLDVTDAGMCQDVVDGVLARHGRIDALVNNAGFGAYIPLEETDVEAMRAMYEVNVFGLHRLTRMVLPAMRAQGGGRIVNVSSVAGHLSFPMLGTYCSTKYAVRAMSQALHDEVRPFGIRVSLVEPGRITTRFADRAHTEAEPARADGSPYAQLYRRGQRILHPRGAHPRVIAKRIAKACTARRPRFHYVAPLDAKAGYATARLLPDAWFRRLATWYFWRGRAHAGRVAPGEKRPAHDDGAAD